jgi:hypothetical protein
MTKFTPPPTKHKTVQRKSKLGQLISLPFSVTINYEAQSRRLTMYPTGDKQYIEYASLVLSTLNTYPILRTGNNQLSFSYVDDFDNNVTMSSHKELVEAIRIMSTFPSNKLKYVFTVSIVPTIGVTHHGMDYHLGPLLNPAQHHDYTCNECDTSPIVGNR